MKTYKLVFDELNSVWESWEYLVKADSIEEAHEKFKVGDYDNANKIDTYDYVETIESEFVSFSVISDD